MGSFEAAVHERENEKLIGAGFDNFRKKQREALAKDSGVIDNIVRSYKESARRSAQLSDVVMGPLAPTPIFDNLIDEAKAAVDWHIEKLWRNDNHTPARRKMPDGSHRETGPFAEFKVRQREEIARNGRQIPAIVKAYEEWQRQAARNADREAGDDGMMLM